jgi:ABC-type bacteriocin/lantibiotic exporter with double-glycine peptidase domain
MITGVLAVVCLNISTITTSMLFAFYYSWKLTLIVLATTPLLVISGSINMKVIKGMH